MNKAKVSDGFLYENFFILRTLEDVVEYAEHVGKALSEQITTMLKSGVPKDRWDHLMKKDDAGGVLSHAWAKCYVEGKNPLIESCYLLDNKIKTFMGAILKGRIILVNKVGGYRYMVEDYTIIKEWVYTPDKTYRIVEGSKYINLENDAELEVVVKDYLKSKTPYSYILNLRDFSKDSLIDVFDEFKEQGGEVVYVYTTGTDIPQMYEYMEAALKVGLRSFEFEFNSGMSPEILEFKDHWQELVDLEIRNHG